MAKSEVRESDAHTTREEATAVRHGGGRDRSPAGLIIKIVVLAVVLGIAVWAALLPLADQRWVGLAIVVLVTALLFYIYLSPRRVPAKYLIPGTLFLIVFQIVPVLYTMSTAFTNFGDAHRGSKQDAIAAIEGTSVQQVPGTPEYVLSLATEGDPTTGDIVFLLTDPAAQQSFAGTSEGLEELAADDIQGARRQGRGSAGLHRPQHRPGECPCRGHLAVQRADRQGRHQEPGPVPGLRGDLAAGL